MSTKLAELRNREARKHAHRLKREVDRELQESEISEQDILQMVAKRQLAGLRLDVTQLFN